MKNNTFGGYRTINSFVRAKLARLEQSPHNFRSIMEIMFSERENVMYEESRGYRIIRKTYGEVYDEILSRLPAMKKAFAGLPAQTVIGICMDNSLAWIEMFWGVLACGFRPLLMNLRLDDAQLAYALSVSGAGAVISDGRHFNLPSFEPSDFSACGNVAAEGDFGEEILLMSSGTSSHLKICAYSAEEFTCLIRGSYASIRECGRVKKHYDGSLKLLTFLPFYHIFGLVAVYIWFAFFSRTFVQLNDLSPATILNTVRRHGVTHIFAVPLFWEKVYSSAMKTVRMRGDGTEEKLRRGLAIAKRLRRVPLLGPAFSRVAFSQVREAMFGESVRFMITGGSRIDEEVISFFNSVGYHLANGYGMTEIGITSVELSEDRRLLDGCFVGHPLDGVRYRLSDRGHLLVSTEAGAKYVITDGERVERPEWFDTMDLAECVRGHYRILGRADDLIVSVSGENLNPNLIEPCFNLPGVRGACLVGAQKNGNTLPVLLLSLGKYVTPDAFAQIDARVQDALEHHCLQGQISEVFYTSDPLLTGEEFKLNRRRLAADYAAGRLCAATLPQAGTGRGTEKTADPDDEIAAFIVSAFAQTLGRDKDSIGCDDDFFSDLGGGSLDFLGVIAQICDEFEVPFPGGEKTPTTVRALHDFIIDKGKNH